MQWLALPNDTQKKLLELCVIENSDKNIAIAMREYGVSDIRISDVKAFKRANRKEIAAATNRIKDDLLLACTHTIPEYRISQLSELHDVVYQKCLDLLDEEAIAEASKLLSNFSKLQQRLASELDSLRGEKKENDLMKFYETASPKLKMRMQKIMFELNACIVEAEKEQTGEDIIDAEFYVEDNS